MPRFFFQPDSIDGYEFYPIPIDIHLGIVKIPTKEILHDNAINNTESIIVGTDRKEVLERLQTSFTREFERYGKLKESDIRPTDYATRQAWIRIKKHIKKVAKDNKGFLTNSKN
jgi:hypothetical protein